MHLLLHRVPLMRITLSVRSMRGLHGARHRASAYGMQEYSGAKGSCETNEE